MPAERRVWQPRRITLTPLIDIIFLLLLFFMLSSTFTRFAELPLMNSGGGVAADGPPPVFLRLGAEGLQLNGEALNLEALPAALAAFAPEGDADTVTLLVTLDAEVTSQDLVDLLVLLQGKTWLAVSVLN
jgi:biopolymer transport protein ExbD